MIFRLVVFALILGVVSVARAAEPSVTFREALILALERNHLVSGAAYEKEAAEHAAAATRSRYLPRITFDETFGASNSPTRTFMMKLDQGRFTQDDFLLGNLNSPSVRSDFRTMVSVEQPLVDFGIGYAREAAVREAEAEGRLFERRRDDVGFAVYAACLAVQRARAVLDAAEKETAEAREHLRVTKARSDEGAGLRSDELRARTYLSEAEERTITALNDLKLARMRLALAVGGGTGESLDIREELKGEPLRMQEEELVRTALASRQDLKGAEKGVERAEAGVALASSAWLPTLYAGASYQMNDRDIPFGRDNDAWNAGVTLRWELFDGMRRCDETARARASRDAAAQYLEQFRKEVALQVRESILRRAEAGKRLEVARHSFLAAEEGMRLVKKRFEGGLATLVELLDAQTALNRSRSGLVERETDLLLATARIYHAAGIFLKEMAQ